MSYDCPDCDELPSEARAVRDLYTTMEYYKERYYVTAKELEATRKELKQLRQKEETP